MKLFFTQLLILFGLFITMSCNVDENTTSSKRLKDELSTAFKKIDGQESGIDFVNQLKDDPLTERNVLSYHHYYNGAGVAVGDINNDGWVDIFFVSNEGENKLYLNKGGLKFEDITEGSGINPPNKYWSTGAVMADVNTDGWMDIYVCQAGYKLHPREERGNLLLINNGDNTFTEQAAAYGIDDRNESISAAFFDYDKDGDQDLYVLNESEYAYVVYAKVFQELEDPQNLANASGNLFRNDNGKFTNVTEQSGLQNYGFGLGLNVSDLNNDGWPDIYVSNDYSVPDFMYINNGDGTFTDQVKTRTKQISYFGMGNDIADINNDALPDIAVVDMAAADHVRGKTLMTSMDIEGFWYFIKERGYQYAYMFNTLQLNNGNGTFSNIASLAGLLQTDWSWAILLADLDNDGWKDSYITNGYRRYSRDNDFRNYMDSLRGEHNNTVPTPLREEVYQKIPEMKTENLVYKNNGDLTFKEVGEVWNLNDASYSYGASYADLDNDGDLDLIVNNIDHEAFLYQNLCTENQGGNFLQLKLNGDSLNPHAYNTKITLKNGDQTQYQEFHPTRGYASSVDHLVHFGLGTYDAVEKLTIEWPNGKISELQNVDGNQRVELDIRNAELRKDVAASSPKPVFSELKSKDLGINYEHRENYFDDFRKEILLPHKQSTLGPKIAVADVNQDGREDLFLGGAHGMSAGLYIQNESGNFEELKDQPWLVDLYCEDMEALFFDADNDQDLDLYVCSGGGGEMEDEDAPLNDRLYINLSERTKDVDFVKVRGWEEMMSSSAMVVNSDIDGDGDQDLFVGGAAQPGRYPYPERSYLLRNDGNFFTDVTEEYAPELMHPGSVKDAAWADINGDDVKDLVLVGEWMPIMILINDGRGHLTDQSGTWGTDDLKGWWYSVKVLDLNDDDKLDIIAGNVGKNTKFSPSKKKPLNLFANDFDKNGVVDIVLSKEYKGRLVPTRGRECSSEQMPFIKDKFPTYEKFAMAELEEILGEEELSNSLHLQANTFASKVLINKGNGFEVHDLPNLAQIAPINSILTDDVNTDGHVDLIIAGNMYHTEVETPRYDAGNGLLLLGDGSGHFEPVPTHVSGFFAPGNVKDLGLLELADGSKLVIVANNDAPPQFFKFNVPEHLGVQLLD